MRQTGVNPAHLRAIHECPTRLRVENTYCWLYKVPSEVVLGHFVQPCLISSNDMLFVLDG